MEVDWEEPEDLPTLVSSSGTSDEEKETRKQGRKAEPVQINPTIGRKEEPKKREDVPSDSDDEALPPLIHDDEEDELQSAPNKRNSRIYEKHDDSSSEEDFEDLPELEDGDEEGYEDYDEDYDEYDEEDEDGGRDSQCKCAACTANIQQDANQAEPRIPNREKKRQVRQRRVRQTVPEVPVEPETKVVPMPELEKDFDSTWQCRAPDCKFPTIRHVETRVEVLCDEKCKIYYHKSCWLPISKEIEKSDSRACVTSDCPGTLELYRFIVGVDEKQKVTSAVRYKEDGTIEVGEDRPNEPRRKPKKRYTPTPKPAPKPFVPKKKRARAISGKKVEKQEVTPPVAEVKPTKEEKVAPKNPEEVSAPVEEKPKEPEKVAPPVQPLQSEKPALQTVNANTLVLLPAKQKEKQRRSKVSKIPAVAWPEKNEEEADRRLEETNFQVYKKQDEEIFGMKADLASAKSNQKRKDRRKAKREQKQLEKIRNAAKLSELVSQTTPWGQKPAAPADSLIDEALLLTLAASESELYNPPQQEFDGGLETELAPRMLEHATLSRNDKGKEKIVEEANEDEDHLDRPLRDRRKLEESTKEEKQREQEEKRKQDEQKKREQEEQRKRIQEQTQLLREIEERTKREQEQKRRREEEELRRKQEEELRRRREEEELRRKQEEERRKREQEEKRLQEQAQILREIEERRKREQEEAKRRQEEELRRKREEELRRKQEEERRKRKQEEERRKSLAEQQRQEEERKRQQTRSATATPFQQKPLAVLAVFPEVPGKGPQRVLTISTPIAGLPTLGGDGHSNSSRLRPICLVYGGSNPVPGYPAVPGVQPAANARIVYRSGVIPVAPQKTVQASIPAKTSIDVHAAPLIKPQAGVPNNPSPVLRTKTPPKGSIAPTFSEPSASIPTFAPKTQVIPSTQAYPSFNSTTRASDLKTGAFQPARNGTYRNGSSSYSPNQIYGRSGRDYVKESANVSKRTANQSAKNGAYRNGSSSHSPNQSTSKLFIPPAATTTYLRPTNSAHALFLDNDDLYPPVLTDESPYGDQNYQDYENSDSGDYDYPETRIYNNKGRLY